MMSMAKSWIPITSSNIKVDVAAAAPNSNSNSNSNGNSNSSIETKAADVGLKILTNSKSKTNHSKPVLQRNQIPSSTTSCYHNNNNQQIPAATSFLKSCFLCHNHLSPNKDIYMYRGDHGFCSEECRNRQIYIDDVQQLQIKILLRQSKSRTTTTTTSNGRRLHCSNHRAPPSTLHTPSPPVFS